MITAILAFFQAIPSLVHGVEAFSKSYFDAKVKITAARIGGDTETAKQIVSGIVAEGQTRVEWLKTVSQSKFLMWMVGGFATPWIIFEWKVIVWDKIVCMALFGVYGYTPPVEGLVAEWAGIILGGIFGTGGVMAAASLFDKWRSKT